jgi:REP element-mobilizing transposase RayT
MEFTRSEILLPEETYHIYNKTVGKERMFKTADDYGFFLQKAMQFMLPVCDIYAYCLLPNHFHFLLKIKAVEVLQKMGKENSHTLVARAFTNFFISYAKSYNAAHHRTGRLFLQSFKRILVDSDDYFLNLIGYIHRNPLHHGVVTNFDEWKYSSYPIYLNGTKTSIQKDEVLAYFNSIDDFLEFHEDYKIVTGAEDYLLE